MDSITESGEIDYKLNAGKPYRMKMEEREAGGLLRSSSRLCSLLVGTRTRRSHHLTMPVSAQTPRGLLVWGLAEHG